MGPFIQNPTFNTCLLTEGRQVQHLLITGGLGNLGAWLCEHLSTQGCQLSILTHRQKEVPTHWRAARIICDVSDAEACQQALAGRSFDAVIHLASYNEIQTAADARKALLINTLGTRNMLEAVRLHSPLAYFVYFSTFQVYGSYEGLITENSPIQLRNEYAATHYFAEEYVRMYHLKYDLPYLILRLTNSYGCPYFGDTSKWYLILNDLARMAVQEKRIALRGNGRAQRDFIWMQDVCTIVEQLLQLAPINDSINLSAGQSKSLLEVAQAVQAAYEQFSGQLLPIMLNEAYTYRPIQKLTVSNNKLSQYVDVVLHERMAAEARRVMELLVK